MAEAVAERLLTEYFGIADWEPKRNGDLVKPSGKLTGVEGDDLFV